jgi:hypothetical protein
MAKLTRFFQASNGFAVLRAEGIDDEKTYSLN